VDSEIPFVSTRGTSLTAPPVMRVPPVREARVFVPLPSDSRRAIRRV
jgi:hypothetical protein